MLAAVATLLLSVATTLVFTAGGARHGRAGATGADVDALISTEELSQQKVLSLARGDAANPSVFIAIGSAPKKHVLRDTVRSTWLSRCQPPSCGYRFFTDGNVTLGDELGGSGLGGVPADVITTPPEEGGYGNFGIRALQQLQWSLRHIDFDHYLRLDDDGLLCVDHLLHDLRQLPLKRLFWGKYWCQHIDENFMLMSRDVAFVLAHGWHSGLLPFRKQMSMDKLTANLQPMMGLDVVGDTDRLRWLDPVLQLPEPDSAHRLLRLGVGGAAKDGAGVSRELRTVRPGVVRNNDAGNVCLPRYERQNTYNYSEQELHWQKAQQLATTWAPCPDICHRFVWLHHLAPAEISRLFDNAAPFDASSSRLANLPSPSDRAESPTQCRSWKGFPLFSTAKTEGLQVQRRQHIQEQSCFWTWCTDEFGGRCCNRQHRVAMRTKIEKLFAAYDAFHAATQPQ